ncbi:DUF4132 domain-containing protein [Actinomadura algeriensis]|uniref:DUF4132 domain-containing protein n=1 Tax=Actinomadura algeriensis TaxID=1679523 RepID=A0ABR9K346_9ACTN|nr:DUF4132 domain-containing protein [Actinomadura algeriensis]MBE1537275.1 hypothetical protein [Actinomadura algeriensis]
MIEFLGPDENTLVMPDDWLRARHPRRDRPGVPEPPAPDPSAPERMHAFVHSVRADIETVLDRSAPDVAAAARAHLRGEPDPLGAAALGDIVGSIGRSREWAAPRPDFPFVDALVAEHGTAFAAHAFTEGAGLVGAGPAHHGVYAPRHRNPGELYTGNGFGTDVARSLRTRLAAAPDDVHAETEKRLEGVRGHDWQRALASYLVPTREDWIDDLCANPGRLAERGFGQQWLVFCAFGRPHQPAASGLRFGRAEARPDVIATLLEAIGPAGVVPLLAQALHSECADDAMLLRILTSLPVDEAFLALLDRVGRPDVARVLPDAAREFPARAVRLLSASAAPLAADLLAAHVRAVPDVAAKVARELPARRRSTVEALLERFPPATGLPPLLTAPPWTRPRENVTPVVLKGLPAPGTRAIHWAPGERDAWAAQEDVAGWDRSAAGRDFADMAARYRAKDGYGPIHERILLLRGPADLVRPLLAGWTVDNDHYYDEDEWLEWLGPLVARHEAAAHDVVLALARRYPAALGRYAMPLLSDEVARTMADWLVRLKTGGRTARAWFERHGHAAVPFLLPDALGKAGPARRAAEAALRLIADRHGPDAVVEAARVHGDRAAASITTVTVADPLDVLPKEVPDTGWADPRVLPQILLRDRAHALPDDAVRHVVTMLAMSKPDAPYPGVHVVRDLCDPESLAGFGWALFRHWEFTGAPLTEKWAISQLGLTGDDDTVRRLTPVIRAWPGDNGHSKAVVGLDVLTAIGTDTALMHLNSIAQRVKYQGIKGQAQARIEELAADLGLSCEQLADRLVPDFGLDASGTLTLDYGPRRFVIGFDEHLRPTIADEDGKVRKSLPKPGAKDDPELAPAASKRFAALRKDVRTVAADQLRRLEQDMLTGRRRTAAEFREFLAGHPLVGHLVRRLVWLAENEDGTAVSFRVAEDRTFADAADETVTVPDDARVRVAHPIHLGDDLPAWTELFADYEILQPFEQLGRPVHTLTAEESETGRLTRFENRPVDAGALLGLTRRGWERGAPMDAGIEQEFYHPGPGCGVDIDLDPGISVGDPEDQIFRRVRLGSTRDPVAVSEVLADLLRVTAPADGTAR